MQIEAAPDGVHTNIRPDADTPFRNGVSALRLTQSEADGVRAFIRELKPGIYIKCPACEKLKYNVQEISITGSGILCDGCH